MSCGVIFLCFKVMVQRYVKVADKMDINNPILAICKQFTYINSKWV